MDNLTAWIYGERFRNGKRLVRRMHTHERRSEGVTPQRIALGVVSECDNSLLIEIVLMDFDGLLVLRYHLCDGAHVSRAKPKQEKTCNPEPKKDVRGPENHERDCSGKGPMNQVSLSVQAMLFRSSHAIGTNAFLTAANVSASGAFGFLGELFEVRPLVRLKALKNDGRSGEQAIETS